MTDFIISPAGQQFSDILFQWILPCSIMVSLFLIFISHARSIYEKFDTDRTLKAVVKVVVILALITGVWLFMTNNAFVQNIIRNTQGQIDFIKHSAENLSFVQKVVFYVQSVTLFIYTWLPIYFRAFVITIIPAFAIQLWSLYNRVSFARGLNIILLTTGAFPVLIFKYFLGYQTPVFDFLTSRLYVAKMKENLNDSNFDALQGFDEKGERFKDGAGGTNQTTKIKKATIAIRQTKVSIKTISGHRKAKIITRHSRETETDKLVEMILSGFGKRLSAPSIRFQDNPILIIENRRGGFVFDSDVPYNSGDYLGSWNSIFVNPFSREYRRSNGGDGWFETLVGIISEYIVYFLHLSPMALYEQTKTKALQKFTIDRSAEKAKFKVQGNLNLDLIPDPVDRDTGNTIQEQKEIALKVARDRTDDVQRALSSYKLSGTFNKLVVGGSTAVYEFTLPNTADLPTDFKKIQTGISNMLKIKQEPIIIYRAGVLSVSMDNGVTVPIDFKDMIKNRQQGVSSLISGLIGVDALGVPITFELGDAIPHAILFGKTGTGKSVTILDIIYSVMDATDPDHVKFAYVDGKGNTFEFMRTDNPDSPSYHPNPYTYAQPADGSGDIEYTRALVKHLEKETRRRIDLFKKSAVTKLADYNKKFPDKAMPVIFLVYDEFSAITDRDKELKGEDLLNFGVVDTIEYIAKMSRSAGIHMLGANQTARKEKVSGKITANISGRVSLGVSEPIESEIALPETGISAHKISQQGEFYSLMKGSNNPEHGFSPYLPDDVMHALNADLEEKFGHRDYVITRDEILKEAGLQSQDVGNTYPIPDPLPSAQTSFDELKEVLANFPEWAVINKKSPIFTNLDFKHDTLTPKQKKKMQLEIIDLLEEAESKTKNSQFTGTTMRTRKNAGSILAPEEILSGRDEGIM